MVPPDWHIGPETWQAVVAHLSDGVAIVDPAGVLRYVNQAFCQVVGFDRDELVGKSAPFPHWPEDQHAYIKEALQRMLAGAVDDFELPFRKKDGRRITVLVHAARLEVAGAFVGIATTFKDVTERARREEDVRLSEELWRSVAENPFDYVMTIDRDFRFTWLNRFAPGVDPATVIAKLSPFDFVHVRDREMVRRTLAAVIEDGKPRSYEAQVPGAGGWFSTVVGPIYKDGRIVGASMLSRDVTAKIQAELALQRSQRMEALGRLAGGIAHDLNNLLMPIMANAFLAQEAQKPGDESHELLTDIVRAAERAKELVSRILIFGRGATPERQPVRVQDIAAEVVQLLRSGAPRNVEIVADLDPACPAVDGIPGEIHQIVTNLTTNAIQALDKRGGKVEVAVRPLPADGKGQRVGLSVQDNGPGIDPSLASKVFEPFFSTRPVGEGTGLGLSIVQALASRYGGTVELTSAPGKGARFDVHLSAFNARAGA